MKKKELQNYLRKRVAEGKHWFVKNEALLELGLSSTLFNLIASRLARQKLLCYLGKGFFAIISDRDSIRGYPYPAEYLNAFMKHIGMGYYVSLLQGAFFYGAAHQQPQTFHILSEKQYLNKTFEKLSIECHKTARFAKADYELADFSKGPLMIASREQVCVDVVTFYEVCGYWNNVATVIKELINDCRIEHIEKVIQPVKTVDLQRFGYILDFISESGQNQASIISQVVFKELSQRKVYPMLLSPHEKPEDKNDKWSLIINDYIEFDE